MMNADTIITGALTASHSRHPIGSHPSSQPTVSPSDASHCNAPSSRMPAAMGPSTSPMLPVERCMDMNRARRWGNRCASSPNAGGCHSAAPEDAQASANSSRAKDGDTAISSRPTPDRNALMDSTQATR